MSILYVFKVEFYVIIIFIFLLLCSWLWYRTDKSFNRSNKVKYCSRNKDVKKSKSISQHDNKKLKIEKIPHFKYAKMGDSATSSTNFHAGDDMMSKEMFLGKEESKLSRDCTNINEDYFSTKQTAKGKNIYKFKNQKLTYKNYHHRLPSLPSTLCHF